MRILYWLRSFLPSPLPLTVDELDLFTSEILSTYLIKDDPSYRSCVASQIMHLDKIVTHAPKRYFAKAVLKNIANQTAYFKMQQIRQAEKEREASLTSEEGAPDQISVQGD